jgi:hypothetical protein
MPVNVVDSAAFQRVMAVLQETDSRHVLPVVVAHYYASFNVIRILPIELPCKMDAFGIIRH